MAEWLENAPLGDVQYVVIQRQGVSFGGQLYQFPMFGEQVVSEWNEPQANHLTKLDQPCRTKLKGQGKAHTHTPENTPMNTDNGIGLPPYRFPCFPAYISRYPGPRAEMHSTNPVEPVGHWHHINYPTVPISLERFREEVHILQKKIAQKWWKKQNDTRKFSKD